jgi:aspartyl-tRNA(Asn)/glutamyl-tRNA(Gln) amidotransferase subunit A
MPIDTAFLSVSELAEGYRSGAFSPVDVCVQAQERLAAWESRLNAFITPMTEAVLEQAAQATDALNRGEDHGPLHGIPVAVKDIIDVAGTETSYATKAVPPKMAANDAECVHRLRAAGAIIFGKTNLLEFAAGIAHPDFGQTNNPFDPALTAGGSSGGSAAAVAAGIVPLAIGTDTGGSVRAPAAYCGIVGFKPSFGILSLQGVFPLSPSLDHLGLLARSVEDTAMLFNTLTMSPLDPQTASVSGLRLGIVSNQWNHIAVRPGVRRVIENARTRLENAGVEFVTIDLPEPEEMARHLMNILTPEAAIAHQRIMAGNQAGYAPGTRELLSSGMQLPAMSYIEATRHQKTLKIQLTEWFGVVDALIAPTVPFVAPASDPALSADGDEEIIALAHANLTGAPSISIACGMDCGLPIGLQLTGQANSDTDLLKTAAAVERILACAI